jgi:hypothetical protein
MQVHYAELKQVLYAGLNELDQEVFEQFCHLSARRIQCLARLTFRGLTGKAMAGEIHDIDLDVPAKCVALTSMRMAEVYRASSPELRRKMVAAQALLEGRTPEVVEAQLSDLERVLSTVEEQQEDHHG